MEDDWFDLVPEAFASILSHSRKGNFLAAFGRNLDNDQLLSNSFHQNWKKNLHNETFRFENFQMKYMDQELSNLSVLAEHMNLLRSDHSKFWVVNNKNYFASLPAILLSDLGPYR